MYHYTSGEVVFWHRFSLEDDHRFKFGSICKARQYDCETSLLMTSCFQKNGFGSNGIDSLGCWHVEPHWRLVHISDVDQTVVLASPRSNHKRLEAGDLFFEFVLLHEPSAPPTRDEEIVDIHLLCVFFGVQTDQISCHGEPTLSVFLDPFDDLFLEPIRASCVMSRFSSHAHHVIFQHGMQLWKTLVKPKWQSTFWLVILIYDQTKWILKGTDNILMSGYGNKCQNACRGKLNQRLIKLTGERIWSVHRVVQDMSVRL